MATEKQMIDIDAEIEKIKAFNPQIVVSDSPDKPYYSISYYDIAKKEWYIGYSSYYLENVCKWLFECFEEVDCDMVGVVRCRDCKHWIHMEDGMGDCTNRRFHIPDLADICMSAEEFCCLGERKDNAM